MITLNTVLEHTRSGLLTAYQKDNLILFFATCYLTKFELSRKPLSMEELNSLLKRNANPFLDIGAVEILYKENEVR